MAKAAFPIAADMMTAHDDWHGMELRDYFASHVLAAGLDFQFLVTAKDNKDCEWLITNAAVLSYRIADAMLKERQK